MRDLRVRYGAVEAVRGVSFDVSAGLTTLLGPNGAGKSSIFGAISGLVDATGTVQLGEDGLGDLAPEERTAKGLAYIPDGRRLFPTLTVEQNLVVGSITIKDRQAAKAAVESTFELFPILAERRGQAAGSLSGGEGQQLLIARALVAAPRVLLVDEPTQGLSLEAAAMIETLLRQVALHAAVVVATPTVWEDATVIRIEHGTIIEVIA